MNPACVPRPARAAPADDCAACPIGREPGTRCAVAPSADERMLRALAALAGGLAHQLNNRLGAVLGLAELAALDVAPGSRQAANLERLADAGRRAAGLVQQMLDYAGQTPGAPRTTTLGALLADAADALRPTLPDGVALDCVVERDARVVVDPALLLQAIGHLAANAVQAMPAGGTLRLVADRLDGPPPRARLSVVDEGVGIEPALLERVFEPFFTTRAVGDGLGLGLSAAHGLVRSHGGCLTVRSAPGAGSAFSVLLPCVER